MRQGLIAEQKYGPIPGTNICEYAFPLRDGLVVKLFLPIDLKRSEVDRLKKLLEALTLDESV